MAENYFDEDDGPQGMAEGGMDKGKEGEESHEGKTAMLNKEICPDAKVGDVIMLRVAEDHDQEFVVEYEGKQGEGEEKGDKGMAEEPSESGGGESEYASMME